MAERERHVMTSVHGDGFCLTAFGDQPPTEDLEDAVINAAIALHRARHAAPANLFLDFDHMRAIQQATIAHDAAVAKLLERVEEA